MSIESGYGDKVKAMVMKPAVVAGTGLALSKVFYPSTSGKSIDVFGMQMPADLAIFGTLFGASMLGELAHQWIFPYVHRLLDDFLLARGSTE